MNKNSVNADGESRQVEQIVSKIYKYFKQFKKYDDVRINIQDDGYVYITEGFYQETITDMDLKDFVEKLLSC